MASDVRPTQVTTPADDSFFPACFLKTADSPPGDGGAPNSYDEATQAVFDAMREENPAILSDETLVQTADQCHRSYLVGKVLLAQQFNEASLVGRIWQGLFGGGFKRLEKEYERCIIAQRRWQDDWARYAQAMALYAVARIDMKDIGHISQDEFDTAEAYAVSWMRYFGKGKQMEMDRARSESLSTHGDAAAIEEGLDKLVRALEDKAWDLAHDNLCR